MINEDYIAEDLPIIPEQYKYVYSYTYSFTFNGFGVCKLKTIYINKEYIYYKGRECENAELLYIDKFTIYRDNDINNIKKYYIEPYISNQLADKLRVTPCTFISTILYDIDELNSIYNETLISMKETFAENRLLINLTKIQTEYQHQLALCKKQAEKYNISDTFDKALKELRNDTDITKI